MSSPDWLNEDIATFRTQGVGSPAAGLDGTTAEVEEVLGLLIDDMAKQDPELLLVAGDLVGGHWSDPARGALEVLAPGGSQAQFIEAAADVYYGAWKQRFFDRGIARIWAALGDHDIGDNPWPAGSSKSRSLDVYRDAFARHFTLGATGQSRFEPIWDGVPASPSDAQHGRTAYAARHRNLLVVTVDVFHHDPRTRGSEQGVVRATVAGAQLEWLDSVLSAADCDPTIDHIIVQGHTPVVTPVRRQSSSGMTLEDGVHSEFWRLLQRHRVTAYFAGEVHATTALQDAPGGTVQVVHGRPPTYGGHDYLVGTVDGSRLLLEMRSALTHRERTTLFWTVDSNGRAGGMQLSSAPTRVGVLEIIRDGDTRVLRAEGRLELVPPKGLLLYYPLDGLESGELRNEGALRNEMFALKAPPSARTVQGKVGRALRFDGVGGTPPTVAQGPIVRSNARTLAMWVRSTRGEQQVLAGWGRVTAKNGLFQLRMKGDQLVLRVGQGRSTSLTGQAPGLSDGQWHHVAAVLPGADAPMLEDVRLYLDGARLANGLTRVVGPPLTETLHTHPGAKTGMALGHDPSDGSAPLRGALDEVVVYGRAMDDGQIRALYELGTQGIEASAAEAEPVDW